MESRRSLVRISFCSPAEAVVVEEGEPKHGRIFGAMSVASE